MGGGSELSEKWEGGGARRTRSGWVGGCLGKVKLKALFVAYICEKCRLSHTK